MKISAVTVWYNPEKLQKDMNIIDNLKSYSGQVEKIYIIDNSKKDNSFLLENSGLNNVEYYPNLANFGIAKALNDGFEKAKADGFEFVLSMDQDSFWDSKELTSYIEKTEELMKKDSLVCSVGPNVREERIVSVYSEYKTKLKKALGKYKEPPVKVYPDYEECLSVITSGNIISLKEWENVGKFNEEFFIDQVDNEFCFRLLRAGKKVVKLNCVKLNHCLGEKKRTFFGRAMNYNGIRIYYIVRNSNVIHKYYPEYTSGFENIIGRLFLDSCVLNIRGLFNLRHFIKGIRDSRKIVIK